MSNSIIHNPAAKSVVPANSDALIASEILQSHALASGRQAKVEAKAPAGSGAELPLENILRAFQSPTS